MYPLTNLQFGQSGDEVKKLQTFLISQGMSIPSGPTGYFGNETKNALTQWQKQTGVDAGQYYGYWGPKSQKVAAVKTNPSGMQNVLSESEIRRLEAMGYREGDTVPGFGVLQPDGTFSNATVNTQQSAIDDYYNISYPKNNEVLPSPQPAQPAQPAAPASPTYSNQPAQPVNEQPYSDEEYQLALENNPVIKEYEAKGNSIADLEYAIATGDISSLVDQNGQPFSLEDQQAALAKAEEDTKLYYEALKSKETADAESALAQKKADYQDYLLNSGQQFESDKAKSDQSASDRGVLFSGGRVQREKNLARAYEQDQASKQASIGRSIGDTARDYQYKYGNESANALSDYYKLGGNTYNPNVARGGVGTTSLASIYDPSKYNYQGTTNVERKTEAQKRAAGYLWNKGNKLLATGYQNQY